MGSRWIMLVVWLAVGCRSAAQPPLPSSPDAVQTSVRLTFQPQSDTFAAAARAYEELWAAEGARMVAALEAGSGLRFVQPDYADTAITVVVFEGVSSSGYRDAAPMMMRASYSADTKKATLLHELGHRLMGDMFRRDEEPHAALFLWLYDVWIDMYGQAFADEQVAVESAGEDPTRPPGMRRRA